MAWYRRSSKLFSEVFRWKIGLPRKPMEEPLSRAFSSYPKFSTSYKISESSFRVDYIGQWKRPFDAKRFYNAAPRHQSSHADRGILVLAFFGFYISAFLTYQILSETAPYNDEKKVGEIQIEQIKKQFKGKIVDPLHPDITVVQGILHYIILALHRGLSYDNNLPKAPIENSSGLLLENVKNGGYNVKNDLVEDKWDNADLVLDYKWIEYRRKMGRYQNLRTLKMFEWEWEVVVVDEPDVVDAFCLPGGKIVVFTGLLRHFRSNSDIAAIIGHQVGHAVLRHHAKHVSRENQWSMHPFSPREEMEADSIGLLLAACAGYDPRVAPHVYEKLATFDGDYDATHSSGKKRAQLLDESQVMKNAIYIYEKVKEGQQIHGFLNR